MIPVPADPGTMDTIFTISGIFFLYNFLVGLSGKTGNGVHGVQMDLSLKQHSQSSQRDLPGYSLLRRNPLLLILEPKTGPVTVDAGFSPIGYANIP